MIRVRADQVEVGDVLWLNGQELGKVEVSRQCSVARRDERYIKWGAFAEIWLRPDFLVAGLMPRPITLTRQQIVDTLTGLTVDATMEIKHPDDGRRIGALLTGFDASKIADALVAASENR